VGSGFRTFTAGEVLTASNVQNYLMDQSVMVFGGSAARSSAIGTANFEEGMVSYLTDTDKVEAYNGTDWVSVAPTTSQGLTLINTTSFSAVSSQSINDVFSASYTTYKIIIDYSASVDGTGLGFKLRVSGTDASTNYNLQDNTINGTSVTASRTTGATGWDVNITSTSGAARMLADITITSPFEARPTTAYSSGATSFGGNIYQRNYYLNNTNATSYTGFTLIPGGGTITGSVSVYGYNK
jgi:hypothetical protein